MSVIHSRISTVALCRRFVGIPALHRQSRRIYPHFASQPASTWDLIVGERAEPALAPQIFLNAGELRGFLLSLNCPPGAADLGPSYSAGYHGAAIHDVARHVHHIGFRAAPAGRAGAITWMKRVPRMSQAHVPACAGSRADTHAGGGRIGDAMRGHDLPNTFFFLRQASVCVAPGRRGGGLRAEGRQRGSSWMPVFIVPCLVVVADVDVRRRCGRWRPRAPAGRCQCRRRRRNPPRCSRRA